MTQPSGAKPRPDQRRSLLFVCTGNICRSPTAEGMFRAMVAKAGLDEAFLIDSCGTHGYHTGHPPHAASVFEAQRRGYDLSMLRARPLQAACEGLLEALRKQLGL